MRKNRPHPEQRARYLLGWALAYGADPFGSLTCEACERPMATSTLLAGIGGRPTRAMVLAHSTPYVQCERYGWDVLVPTCDYCNNANGDEPVDRFAFDPMVTAIDVRVDTPTARAWLREVRAISARG